MKKFYSIIIIVLITLIVLTGCSNVNNTAEGYNNTNQNISVPITEESEVDKILKTMTLDEKIGQMFMVNLEELETGYIEKKYFPTVINEKQITNLKKYNVGGVIYFSGNLTTKEALVKYNKDLQGSSKYSLFIGVDEEGGKISRLGSNSNIGVTKFPPMKEIGDTGDVNKAYNVGETLGKELKALGFNLDFAPVADVNTNPKNPIIGDRAFGSDANKVSEMVAAEVKGMQAQNISSALKHFPGHRRYKYRYSHRRSCCK